MGLDITAYRGLTKDTATPVTDDYDYETRARFWSNSDFPKHMGSLEEKVLYSFSQRYGFRAGSYSGYNQWRDALAKLVGINDLGAWWKDEKPGPFMELLGFSDCEGTIGPEYCAKLHKDFADHLEQASRYKPFGDHEANQWWFDQYKRWMQAFEMGMDGGAVDFH